VKRHLLVVGGCIVLGAVITVVVAWRCSRLSQYGDDRTTVPGAKALRLWQRYAPVAWGHERIDGIQWQGFGVSRIWLEPRPITRELPIDDRACLVMQAGWPFRSLEGAHYDVLGSQELQFLGIWRLHPRIGPLDLELQLPLRPLGPGFVLDTVVFAGALWLAGALMVRGRRRGRLDNGKCPRCTYDLRATPAEGTAMCPECGAEVAGRLLKRPRQVLRWWMAPLLGPPLLGAALWFLGAFDWLWLRFQLRWEEPIVTRFSIASFTVCAAWLYAVGLKAYRDRPARQRHLVSASVSVVLTAICLTSVFVLAVRFAG
jgi:hypothetical protein